MSEIKIFSEAPNSFAAAGFSLPKMSTDQICAPRERWASPGRREHRHREARVVRACGVERKFATVLFADVQSSMNLIAACGLEEWWSMIAGGFESMSEAVRRFGGWIGSFTGDGIKAVFETPHRHGGHARRACDPALWLRGALERLAAELLRERGLKLRGPDRDQFGGEVLTGTIGGRYGRYYTANGHPVGLAKRIETLALPGRVYLTEHTAAVVAEAFELRDLGRFHIKGARLPVGAFELVGER